MKPHDSAAKNADAGADAPSRQDLPRQLLGQGPAGREGAEAVAGTGSRPGADAGDLTRGVAVHVVGEADIGLPHRAEAELVEQRLAELRSRGIGAADDIFAGTPIRRFVDMLAQKAADAAAPPVDRVVLLATTDGEGATAAIAEAMIGQLRYMVEECRLGLGRTRVGICRIRKPTTDLAREWTRGYLTDRGYDRQTTWMVGLGAGATGIFLGVLFELLIRRLPVELWPEDPAAEAGAIDLYQLPSEEEVRRWLVRHRYYDALAALDPKAWGPLAERQAVDVKALLTRACGPSEDGCWSLDGPAGSTARKVLAEAVHAAFAEGLARQEITDGAAARTWLRRFVIGFVIKHGPRELLKDILALLDTPRAANKDGRPPIDPTLAARVDEPLASLLQEEVVLWHQTVKANSHGALAELAEPPASVVALQNAWIREQHTREPLVAYPAWPVRELSRRQRNVLLLRAVGDLRGRGEERDRATVAKIVDRLGSDNILAVELATPQVVPPTDHSSVRVHRVEVTEDNIIERPGLARLYQSRLLAELRKLPEAELADEVAVVVPAGPKALVTAAMLAAVDWSLHIAAPLVILALDGDFGPSGPIATKGVHPDKDRALASLGADDVLARLAKNALCNLDLTLAARLLDRGSARLHGLASKVREFQNDAFGVLPPEDEDANARERTSAAEIALAPARLRLCTAIVDRHPWDAAYLASSVVDHSFRMPPGEVRSCVVPGIGRTVLTDSAGWVPVTERRPLQASDPEHAKHRFDYLFPWKEVRHGEFAPTQSGLREVSPSVRLRKWRNDHPLSHGIEKKAKGKKPKVIRVPSAGEIRELIRDAEQELVTALRAAYPPESYPQLYGRDPGELVRRHAELVAEAARLAGEIPAARAANGSQSAASAGTSEATEPVGVQAEASSSRIRSATSTEESK